MGGTAVNYIVFDLEWNQGESPKEQELTGLPFEIVEIGAVRLDVERRVTGQFTRLIRPQVYHKMHRYTEELIHLSMEELERDGELFPDVVTEFLDWCGEDPVFCTWGTLDLTELQRNMEYYGMEPLTEGRPLPFLDVQKLFSLAFEDGKSRRSLTHAIEQQGIEADQPFHRALSDAVYTARLLQRISPRLLRNISFDAHVTPQDAAHEVHIVFDTYAKFISRTFETRDELLGDQEVMSTKCYLCHHNIRRKVKWFTPNNGRYYLAVANCDRHGFVKYKLRIRSTEDGGFYAVKTAKFIDEAFYEDLRRLRRTSPRPRGRKNS